MRLSSGIVLVTLISLLSVFVGVKSDGKSFPYTPASVANLCSKDSIHVMLLIDTSSATQSSDMIAHATDLASSLMTTYAPVTANPVVMSVHSFSTGFVTLATISPNLATIKNAINSVTFNGGIRNTGTAISSAAAYANAVSNLYPRRVIYVLTSGLPADSNSLTGNVYNTHRNVEATGLEVFVELYGAPVQESFPGQIVGLASAPNVTHFVNSTGTLTSTVRRVVSSIRRDLGGSCTVLNNNNIITYDGVGYTPSASGYNVLTQTLFAPLDQTTRTFSVVANGNDITVTSNADTIRFVWNNGEVSTTLNNYEITLAPGPNNAGATQINVALSQLSSGSLGMTINVTTANRDVVQIGFFDTPYVVITPFPDLFGHVVGLCGTWDNCNNNEFVGSDGVCNTNAQQPSFVSSWNVPSYTYNTALYATAGIYNAKAGTEAPPTTVADNAGYNNNCNGIRGSLLKFCNYDASSTPSAAAVYHSLQASTCEQYCQSGIITSSVLQSTDCDSFCTQNYPPLDLFNISNTPPAVFTTRQNVKGLQKYINVFVGGRYVIKATDSEGIVDYTTLEFNCSEELVNVTAGKDVTVTRSPSLGFPQVQLLGDVPQNYVNRAFQLSWKAVSFPYVGQNDNTTTPEEIAAQAPVIIAGTSISPKFTPVMPGQYIFTLAVYDGCMVRYHNVTVNAVCDNCLFTSRVEPVPTVFWGNGQFSFAEYNSYIYTAPQYISPANEWTFSAIQPYNLRNENLTVTQDAPIDFGAYVQIPYHIVLTTGTPQSVYNSTTIPTQTNAGLISSDDTSPYRATPITLTVGLVVEPTPAIISKAHHHRWDYSVVTQTVNVVGVPLDDFLVRSVCEVTMYDVGTYAVAQWAPTMAAAGVADYCTGKYSVQLFADDFCHNSTDVFINQVECDSRPILNAPGCRDDILLVYNPNTFGTTGWVPAGPLDGTNPYDTEETSFTYNWTLVSVPALSRATVNCAGQTCNVQPDFAGDYVVKYTVNDGCRTESATYTLHAVCYQERFISQNVTNTNPEFSGTRINVQLISNSTVAKPTYLRQYTTIISLPTELSNLPPFGAWGSRINGANGQFSPNAKGTWNVDFSAVDECGVLNVTTVPVYYTCAGITGTPSAVISADRYETETSGAFYPAILLDGTASSITSTSYTPVGKYYWYYRPTGSNSVADWVAFSQLAKPGFSAPSAGQWDILLIYSDDCEYATTTITVTANCLPPILTFEIDGTLIDEFGNSSKIVDTNFPWYDPSTYVTLNGTQSQNYSAATVQWIITSAAGDVYTYTTYTIDNARNILTNLHLNYPTGLSGNPVQPFTVALSAASACGVTVTTPAVTLATTCAAKYNGYLNIVTVTADKSSVNFLSSNRFDSSTITAEITFDPLSLGGEPHYKRFLVTQAPANSIYAPQVTTTTNSILNTVYTQGPLNNTGFNGQYNIATTTTTTTVRNTWVWIELETDSNNHSYYACFTPDLPGTYVITTELRDICNNTRIFTNTITAGCPTAITFSSTPNITIDTNNFRDLARVSIDASSVQNPAGSDLKFRWTLSNTNGTYDQTFNGTYFDDEVGSLLTNFYGSVVSFVVPYAGIANTYSARYDIWDGCQTISGYVNISIPAIGHRNIFQNSVAAYNPNNTDAIHVDSLDSIAISPKQYISSVVQDLRQTDCYAADIEYEVVGFQSYVQPPPPPPKKKGTSKGVIIGAVIGSVAGAALIGAAIFGIMKYKARSVAV